MFLMFLCVPDDDDDDDDDDDEMILIRMSDPRSLKSWLPRHESLNN